MNDQGLLGGVGCKVVRAIEIDHTNSSFLLMGTDVGGIYRSIVNPNTPKNQKIVKELLDYCKIAA